MENRHLNILLGLALFGCLLTGVYGLAFSDETKGISLIGGAIAFGSVVNALCRK